MNSWWRDFWLVLTRQEPTWNAVSPNDLVTHVGDLQRRVARIEAELKELRKQWPR